MLVPEGTYLTGAIHLRSNVELNVTKGATILFCTNPEDRIAAMKELLDIFNARIAS